MHSRRSLMCAHLGDHQLILGLRGGGRPGHHRLPQSAGGVRAQSGGLPPPQLAAHHSQPERRRGAAKLESKQLAAEVLPRCDAAGGAVHDATTDDGE